MIITPNITAQPYAAPIHDVGMVAAVQELTTEATQVSTASPYFKLEQNNQQKQQTGERRAAPVGEKLKTDIESSSVEEAVTFGFSTLFLAQMMAQQARSPKAESANTLSTLALDVSALDLMQMDRYARTIAIVDEPIITGQPLLA